MQVVLCPQYAIFTNLSILIRYLLPQVISTGNFVEAKT